MIKLLNENRQALHLLAEVKDYYIESELESADKMIHFLLPRSADAYEDIKQEMYLQNENDIFVIKEINHSHRDYIEIFGKLDVDELKQKVHLDYESVQKHISIVLDELLSALDWTYELHDIPSKLRTVRAEDKTSYDIILQAMNIYGYEVSFDTTHKIVNIYQSIGENKGSYAHSELNMKKIEYQSDSYDFRTRLYAYGAEGMTFASINNGKAYVENHEYSNKILETVWRDDRYTNKANLLEDAQERLNKIAAPRLSYKIDVLQLTDLKPEYKILDYDLGDTIKIIDSDLDIIDNQRVMKITKYPITPEKNKIELANTLVRFKSNQEELEDVARQEAAKVRTDLMIEIEKTNSLIGGETKGYIITRQDENGYTYEQLIMDTPDIDTAQKIWRWNINGLGFSSTGYHGDYRIAITRDGRINADFITTGSLSAEIIKAGFLRSKNGLTWIDMDTGYFNFADMITFDENGFNIKLSSGKTIEESIQSAQDDLESLIDSKASQDEIESAKKQLEALIDSKPTTEELLAIKQEAIDEAGVEAKALADSAQLAAETLAKAQAALAKEQAIADAEGKFNEAAQDRVNQAAATLEEAIAQAEALSKAAEEASKLYAEEQAAMASIARQDIAPDNPEVNMLWLDTSIEPNILYIYDGTEWNKTGVDLKNVQDAIGEVYESLSAEINTTQRDITLLVEAQVTDATNRIIESTSAALQLEKDNINIAISETNDRLSRTSDNLEEIHSHFTFDSSGLTIGKSDNPLNIVISNEEMQFKEGDKKIAWINGQYMYIDELIIENILQVGVHQIRKYDSNTTLVEYVGED